MIDVTSLLSNPTHLFFLLRYSVQFQRASFSAKPRGERGLVVGMVGSVNPGRRNVKEGFDAARLIRRLEMHRAEGVRSITSPKVTRVRQVGR
jgi:hypothetical protein